MNKLRFISLILCLSSIAEVFQCAYGQDNDIVLKPLTVTASRIEGGYITDHARSTDSDTDLMLNSSLSDSRQRGVKGIQTDVSLRAGTFEQTLVLLNGVRMNNPQTGHFSMDLPVTKLDIQNIDLVYGPSSAYYGSSGIGGSVNVITKAPTEGFSVAASIEAGQYDYYDNAVSINLPLGILKNRLSFQAVSSSGYRPETEFDVITSNVNSRISFDKGYLDFMFGHLRKDFGAYNFYSASFENEEEHTDTRLFKIDSAFGDKGVIIKPILYYNRHWDRFILDRNRIDWYQNMHTTHVYGGELSASMDTSYGGLSYGFDAAEEEIFSSSLGKHDRARFALFVENEIEFEKWGMNFGGRFDKYSSFEGVFSPNAALAYDLNDNYKIRLSAGRSFRAPSFTDLYYVSSANIGDPDLKPEKAWSFDGGIDFRNESTSLGITAFFRMTDDIIDWTKKGASQTWYAGNIGEFDVYGFEGIFKFSPNAENNDPLLGRIIKHLEIKYTFIESVNKDGITSKYALNYLKHNLTAEIQHELFFGIVHKLSVSFKNRIGQDPYILLNTYVYKDFKYRQMKYRIFFKGENLLNTDYTEVGSVSMPGTWLSAGAKWEF